MSRLAAAFASILLIPALGVQGSAAMIGVIFLLWSPVLPRWVRRSPGIRLSFYEGSRAEEVPRAIVWGGVDEPVEVLRSWKEERNGNRLVCFRLALKDGTVLDVSRSDPGGTWGIDNEAGD
jgi:hypothetical protein